MKFYKYYFVTGALLLSGFMHPVRAEDALVFSTAPTQPPAQTIKAYQPLVNYLSRMTGKKIVIDPAKNFLEYTDGIRKDKYDLLFDGPHFAAWRMKHHQHKLVAKLPGQLRFVVVVRDDARVKRLSRLAGRKVCTFASPNLLTLGFLDVFNSPASQPILVPVRSFKDAQECVVKGKGVAAVLRDKFWEKMKEDKKKGLTLLYTTDKPFPHRALSASSRVDPVTLDKMRKAMLTEEGIAAGKSVLQRFRSKKFVPANEADYAGLGRLMDPIWGFRGK